MLDRVLADRCEADVDRRDTAAGFDPSGDVGRDREWGEAALEVLGLLPVLELSDRSGVSAPGGSGKTGFHRVLDPPCVGGPTIDFGGNGERSAMGEMLMRSLCAAADLEAC